MSAPGVPTLLYHATRPANVASIREHGLLPNWCGEQYLCNSPADCLVFVGSRIRRAITGNPVDVVIDGVVVGQVPEIEINDQAAIIVVDASRLDPARIEVSNDHVAFFFGDTLAWRYRGAIAPEAIVDVGYVDLTGATDTDDAWNLPITEKDPT